MKSDKNIVADALSRFPIKRNEDTKQESGYKNKLCQKPMTTKSSQKEFSPLIKN